MSGETWADEPGCLHFVKMLKKRREAQIEALVGAARQSTDPQMRLNWGAINQLEAVIADMEAERGKSDE